MIAGTVTPEGIPLIELPIGGSLWRGTIDTGFSGDLELPISLHAGVNPRFVGRVTSILAGGQVIAEDSYLVDFPFDGELLCVAATFAQVDEILIGTRLLRNYRLEIRFPDRLVVLERLG